MKRVILSILLLVVSVLNGYDTPCDDKLMTFMKIATGSKSGTYIKIGDDLARFVAPDSCVKLEATPTKGSVENLMKLLSEKFVALAIVQSDVLAKFKEKASMGNRKAEKIVDRLRLVKPLYMEEVHFVVRKDSLLKKIQDIENARVNIGPMGSGTAMSSLLIYKELFGYTMSENNIFHYDYDDALKRVLSGDIDVAVMVGGQPLKRFSAMEDKAGEIIKFLSYDRKAKKRLSSYPAIKLLKSSYGWLDRDVETVGVPSYLVTFDYGRSPNSYQIKMKKALARMAYNLHKNMQMLKNHGHEKWKEIDDKLQKPLRGWSYYDVTDFAYNFDPSNCSDKARALTLCR
jgi:TRAP transporter TAXI family solute receptor